MDTFRETRYEEFLVLQLLTLNMANHCFFCRLVVGGLIIDLAVAVNISSLGNLWACDSQQKESCGRRPSLTDGRSDGTRSWCWLGCSDGARTHDVAGRVGSYYWWGVSSVATQDSNDND
jgi:hypothetical protein